MAKMIAKMMTSITTVKGSMTHHPPKKTQEGENPPGKRRDQPPAVFYVGSSQGRRNAVAIIA